MSIPSVGVMVAFGQEHELRAASTSPEVTASWYFAATVR
jgi:hypothetical protein